MATCYRHPNRETGVSCSNCGRPICPDCMTPTPVGMRCPECSQQKTQVRNLRSMNVEPIATYILIAINVMLFVGVQSNPSIEIDLALISENIYGQPVGVGDGEWWRLISSGFLHTEILHLGLNMLALFWLGRMIEPALGHARFLGIYFAALLAGSFGALLLDPDALTRGASGAIYGLLGAAIVMARNRNIDLMQSGLLPILGFNLLFTFVVGGISIGGHIGGLVGGLITAFVVEELARRRRNATPIAVGFCAVFAVAVGVATVLMVSP
ncbi:rhomboid family intramembrane serine protease [Solirubrobacter phytolaccae]|uniref:Rhomboid family intramembrane serine protease n=1 Tax=Solirubrobacter phytolaccae TaxID=1404360 RepID=A0A9X3NDX6_9ACTN|nr:rhomboid family intramembrane serine protease [Solirubrobacter phytolaccae]MDA0184334.1 rhomboid family intramembrane serine protease [Solirubrobacter phytolaccae]